MQLPLRIVRHRESIEIEDAVGTCICYLYFCDEPTSRRVAKRLNSSEAIRLAQYMARALTALELAKPD